MAENGLGTCLKTRNLSRDAVTIGSKWGYTYLGSWRLDAPIHEVKDLSLDTLPVSPRMKTAQSTAATLLMSSKTALNFELDPINSDVAIVALRAPLLCDAFADIRGTVSEFRAARLDLREQPDGIAVNKKQIPQVERDGTCLLLEERPEHVDVVRRKSTADSDDHNTSFAHESVDSAGHEHPFSQRLNRQKRAANTRRRKRRTTHNAQKLAKISGCRDCEACESDESGEFRDSGEASAELESAFVDFENPDLVLKRRWRNAKLGCGA